MHPDKNHPLRGRRQKRGVIAFQGVPGAYSEIAARQLFGPDCETLPCETFEEVYAAVSRGKAFGGALPFENSLAGSIHQNYDLLVSHNLPVIGETYVRVAHALMAPRGTRFADLRFVRSHPQALAQCSTFFSKNPKIKPIPWFDTAGAAQSLSVSPLPPHRGKGLGDRGFGAIASESAAQLYGLQILRRNLQNESENFTRFLAIACTGDRPVAPGSHKSTITFHPRRNASGALHKILGVFAARGIDLSKIESRPDPKTPFDYRFYLDLIGSTNDPKIITALKELKPMITDFRILGSYPMAKIPSIKKSPPSGATPKRGEK